MSTRTYRPGLRERKAARLKIRIVDLLTEELARRGFHELRVEELCERAMISKVTFFRYFPTKDALLWYHGSVWIYRMKADCLLRGLEGVDALRFLFRNMAWHLDRHENLYGYFFGRNSLEVEGEERVFLSDAEKLAIHPDGSTLYLDIDYSLGDFLRHHVDRARVAGAFREDVPADTLVLLFGALFNGSAQVGLRTSPECPGEVFATTFEALVDLLKPSSRPPSSPAPSSEVPR